MRRLALAYLVACSGTVWPVTAQDPAPVPTPAAQTSPLSGPEPRRLIAGIAGYTSESQLVFVADQSAQTHRFECCEVFPARSRWCLEAPDEKRAGRRVLQYRFGEQAYTVPAFEGKSVELTGQERLDQLLHCELRRALFLFPDGVQWQRDDKLWRADLGAIGLLVATIGADGLPTSVSSLTAGQEIRDSYKELGWQRIDGRLWPASLGLYQSHGKVWDEQVVAVRTSTRYVDSFFRPPDRRELGSAVSGVDAGPLAIDLRPAARKRLALAAKPDRSWTEVFDEVARIRAELAPEIESSGLVLEPFVYVELDEAGRATAVDLHASPPPAGEPPPGWERLPSRAAVALSLPTADRLTAAALARVREAAGEHAGDGAVLLQVAARDPARGRAKLVLPLEN